MLKILTVQFAFIIFVWIPHFSQPLAISMFLSSYVSNKSFMMFPTVKNLLSIGVFSFSLICKSIAAQFLTVLCSGRWENSCGERFSFVKDNKKFVYQKVSNLVNISPFSSRGNIFRAYQSTLKIIELCFETTAEHCAIYYLKRLARLSPSLRSRNRLCWHTATSTHFWSSKNTTLPMETMHETALEWLDTTFTTRFEAKCKQ